MPQPAGGRRWIICLDTTLDLYPVGLAQLGVDLGRLVVVRTPRVMDALWVAEQALRCRAVAAVLLPLRQLEAYASRRLQLAAESGDGLGLILRPDESGGHTFASSRVRFDVERGDGPRRVRVTVRKVREGRPTEPFVVEWSDAMCSVPASAVSADRASAASCCAGG